MLLRIFLLCLCVIAFEKASLGVVVAHDVEAKNYFADNNDEAVLDSVALLVDHGKSRSCSGILINPRTILTAAHCLEGLKSSELSNMEAVFHLKELGKNGVKVLGWQVAPGNMKVDGTNSVHNSSSSNDVALIYLNRPLLTKMTPQLHDNKLQNFSDVTMQVAGFGANNTGLDYDLPHYDWVKRVADVVIDYNNTSELRGTFRPANEQWWESLLERYQTSSNQKSPSFLESIRGVVKNFFDKVSGLKRLFSKPLKRSGITAVADSGGPLFMVDEKGVTHIIGLTSRGSYGSSASSALAKVGLALKKLGKNITAALLDEELKKPFDDAKNVSLAGYGRQTHWTPVATNIDFIKQANPFYVAKLQGVKSSDSSLWHNVESWQFFLPENLGGLQVKNSMIPDNFVSTNFDQARFFDVLLQSKVKSQKSILVDRLSIQDAGYLTIEKGLFKTTQLNLIGGILDVKETLESDQFFWNQGTLAGSGTIKTSILENKDGILDLEYSTLNLAGDFSQGAQGIMQSSFLGSFQVQGLAKLAGKLIVDLDNAQQSMKAGQKRFDLLKASRVQGHFDAIDLTSHKGVRGRVNYYSNRVELELF